MKLYYSPKSGHSHRARLFLSLLGVEFDLVEFDLAARQHKSADFLRLNAFGQVPVLEDDGLVIADSNAILVYLAGKFGRTDWYPDDALGSARVQRWFSVAAGQLVQGPASARLVTLFGAKIDAQTAIDRAHVLLTVIETELDQTGWLAADRPTIADIALYSYVARAPEGNVVLDNYPRVRAWLERIEALPGFVPFAVHPVGLYAPGAPLAHLATA
ncbi:glutathione S-transferase family protein [Sphingopyxis sp. GW247-27LB]|uniref:glutathione S-transferase family protein n=1 Tax=Sphingopyxis sp. GW247-27LB TaxID=2012632 RepID=UPI000BA6D31E|nr:glutathione S-transferase [Sphingopyxis sp. GW247-27LB]PAL19827.1 glutathione S-transferase [Sphingopyxis sp. GW247-27LB]